MKPQTYVHIPETCHENWDKMSVNQKGRFCESCCKTVVDFQQMTDQEIVNYFSRTHEKTCGRFSDDQLNRALEETKIEKQKGWKWAVASITSFFFFLNRNSAQALQGKVAYSKTNTTKHENVRKPSSTKGAPSVIVKNETVITKGDVKINDTKENKLLSSLGDTTLVSPNKSKLIGAVTDEKGNPIAGVVVTSKTPRGTVMLSTNDRGEYFIETPLFEHDQIELKFSSLGYEEKNIPITFDESKLELHVQLKEKPMLLDEVTVVSNYGLQSCTRSIGGAVARVTVKQFTTIDTFTSKVKKILKVEGVKVYPNPASKGKVVNLVINEVGNYTIELLDNNSKLLRIEHVNVFAKMEVKLFTIPNNIASGTYYIRLINSNTNKVYLNKLLVQ